MLRYRQVLPTVASQDAQKSKTNLQFESLPLQQRVSANRHSRRDMPRSTPASQSIHSIWSRTARREPLLNVRPLKPPITAQAKPGQISVPNPPVNRGVVTSVPAA